MKAPLASEFMKYGGDFGGGEGVGIRLTIEAPTMSFKLHGVMEFELFEDCWTVWMDKELKNDVH